MILPLRLQPCTVLFYYGRLLRFFTKNVDINRVTVDQIVMRGIIDGSEIIACLGYIRHASGYNYYVETSMISGNGTCLLRAFYHQFKVTVSGLSWEVRSIQANNMESTIKIGIWYY